METINHEYYVSLEVAKLLKEAGFDWGCKYAYIITPDGDMPTGEEGMLTEYVENVNWLVSAPTLDVAQRWLREIMKIEVFVEPFIGFYKYVVQELKDDGLYSDGREKSYEEAQETGIKKALELILEKGGTKT